LGRGNTLLSRYTCDVLNLGVWRPLCFVQAMDDSDLSWIDARDWVWVISDTILLSSSLLIDEDDVRLLRNGKCASETPSLGDSWKDRVW